MPSSSLLFHRSVSMQRPLLSSLCCQSYYHLSRGWSQHSFRSVWSRSRSMHIRHFCRSQRYIQRAHTADRKHPIHSLESTKAADSPGSIKPETFKRPSEARPGSLPDIDNLLSEQTVTNKEQRKADWAIIKEMAQYLWPKVG